MSDPEEGGKSCIDLIVDELPWEIHVGNFQFLGPGTQLTRRLALNQTGINPLDAAALQHDLVYSRNGNRRLADEKLIKVALSRLTAENSDNVERSAALLTACCLVSKITLEQFFSRVKKVFSPKRKSKNVADTKKTGKKKRKTAKTEKTRN